MIKKYGYILGYALIVMVFSNLVFAADVTQVQSPNTSSQNQTQNQSQDQSTHQTNSSTQAQSANQPSSIAPPLSKPEEPMVVHTHTPLTEGPVIVQSPSKSAKTVIVQAPSKSEGPVIVNSHSKSEGPVIVSSPSKSEGPVIVQSPSNPNGPLVVQTSDSAATTSTPAPVTNNAPQAISNTTVSPRPSVVPAPQPLPLSTPQQVAPSSQIAVPAQGSVQQAQPSVQQMIQQPSQQATPVTPLQRVLAIDMEGRGDVDDSSLQQGKAALLVLRLSPTAPSHGLGIFTDQAGNRYRVIKGIKDLASLMNKDASDINEGDELYGRLRLGYILMNGRIQTVPLATAKILVIHIGNASDESNSGMVDAYVIGQDNISRIMQEVMWSGYLE